MKGGGMSRMFVAGAGMAAMAAMALVGAGGGATSQSGLRRDEDPVMLRAPSAWRGRGKVGNNRKYARGRYKGSAIAKRATRRGGNPSAY